jgi:hypothetical protein
MTPVAKRILADAELMGFAKKSATVVARGIKD